MATAPSISLVFDDVGSKTGAVGFGGYTNDTAPLVTVALGDQAVAGDTLVLKDGGSAIATVTLSADDITRGRVDIQLSGLGSGWHQLSTALAAAGAEKLVGSGTTIGVETNAPAAPTLQLVTDDAGAKTGAVADGARTDDSTPTFKFVQPDAPPIPTGSPGHAPYGGPAILSGWVQLYDGSKLVGQGLISHGGEVEITSSQLSVGDHTLTAVAVDRAGNQSGATSFRLTVGEDSAPTPPPPPPPPATDSGSAKSGPAGVVLTAAPEGSRLEGGSHDDTLNGGAGEDVLRGGEGSDQLSGGASFDDMHGNQGADTLRGGDGNDWVVGGQGEDRLFGDAGDDIVYGNVGADWLEGGEGRDTVRGGQANDVLIGGAGDDWLAGDKGDDTVTGGTGADTFFVAGASGLDRVTDFSLAEGDRVMVEAGSSYTFAQVGSDTVVTLAGAGGGAQMVLVGVQASTLTGGWIFAG
jgi:Ca2+-binding RTX toxin-like protein